MVEYVDIPIGCRVCGSTYDPWDDECPVCGGDPTSDAALAAIDAAEARAEDAAADAAWEDRQ